jgi:folate-binding protein YgfZ
VCNLQGRVVAFGWASAPADDEILWLVPESVVADLRTFLKPYLAFSKTRLTEPNGDQLVLASITAEQTGNISSRVHIDIVRDVDTLEGLYVRQGLGHRGRIERTLIADRVPLLTSVNAGEYLPQMLGLVDLNAVNFAKGCYLGQEVVARAQHRGQVKRQLVALAHDSATAVEPGSEIIDSRDKVVGKVINSAADDSGADSLCVLQTSAQSPFADRKTGLTMHS